MKSDRAALLQDGPMKLDAAQLDRARGVLLATAAGDALGAPYEFQPPRGPELAVAMVGGGMLNWSPGEWTDDTSMAIAIAEQAATGADLRSDAAQDAITARWWNWSRTAADVGVQTGAVLAAVTPGPGCANQARSAAAELHQRTGRSGGNGSLMRTAPVALRYFGAPQALVEAARALSVLTHYDPEAGDACVLWCSMIRHAVLTGELDGTVGLAAIPAGRRELWTQRLELAGRAQPAEFENNGWVVAALQAAWSAVSSAAVDLPLALERAVRAGNDTDTVAAITGGLIGAVCGAAAVPSDWQLLLHGWPGMSAAQLIELADRIVQHA
jgi:ADP-ribosyl-[dinitrogen reductase] hydrolase